MTWDSINMFSLLVIEIDRKAKCQCMYRCRDDQVCVIDQIKIYFIAGVRLRSFAILSLRNSYQHTDTKRRALISQVYETLITSSRSRYQPIVREFFSCCFLLLIEDEKKNQYRESKGENVLRNDSQSLEFTLQTCELSCFFKRKVMCTYVVIFYLKKVLNNMKDQKESQH